MAAFSLLSGPFDSGFTDNIDSSSLTPGDANIEFINDRMWQGDEGGHHDMGGGGSGNQDGDGDGLTNAEEAALGTDPNKWDSDEDGLSDGVETNDGTYGGPNTTGTDPMVADRRRWDDGW